MSQLQHLQENFQRNQLKPKNFQKHKFLAVKNLIIQILLEPLLGKMLCLVHVIIKIKNIG